uniref:Uncharacterized protein n=1 Tax=Arundo donax TaxID=35708 RepID=A0A0A9AM75_ARUDO
MKECCNYQTIHTIRCYEDRRGSLFSIVLCFSKMGCNTRLYTKRP